MENDCMDGRLLQLIESIDDKIRAVALNANISYEDLRNGYVMSCLHITKPFEYNISNLKMKSEMITQTEKYEDNMMEQATADDNITIQNEKSDNQLRTYQNIPISNKKVHTKKQQRNEFGYGNSSKHKSFIRQRNQQSFCIRNVRGSNVSPSVIPASINTTNRCKMNDDKSNGGNKSLQPKDSNKKKATKFICDIEAALAGEISDMEDERGQVNTDDNKFNKLSNDDAMTTTSASLAEETIRKVQENANKNNHLEARIVRYPNGQSLALNIIHKVYVVHLEDTYAWVRLSDDIEPPCFDQVYVIMKAIQPLQREELLPGTPCVVLARFNPRDIVNDGTTAREVTEFESYARAIIEGCHKTSKTVTVRLVDFGFRLTQLSVTTIKPLTIAFDGPPLAFRLLIDSLSKVI
uniref:Tudor domain-containing protein n=1 Tax=Wuchereria bancrofti TaxID=6293 RepID=A0AAF5PZF9_WUCBA